VSIIKELIGNNIKQNSKKPKIFANLFFKKDEAFIQKQNSKSLSRIRQFICRGGYLRKKNSLNGYF
jgi:hypothetical protein